MECHSRPAVAPPAMIASYGPDRGFGWKPDSVVAAQIVSVPMSVPVGIAKQAFHLLIAYLAIALLATILALDAGVYFIVIRPLKLVSEASRSCEQGRNSASSACREGQ